MVLDGKSLQEYHVNSGDPQGSILVPTLFFRYVNDLPDDVTCTIALNVENTTPYSKRDRTSPYLWQHSEFSSELESDLRSLGTQSDGERAMLISLLWKLNLCFI